MTNAIARKKNTPTARYDDKENDEEDNCNGIRPV